ncbi:MAG: flavoprotein [Verrucomicrobiales bacterium]|nr:flavoprotein [Verrucomicrobiales bacterium]
MKIAILNSNLAPGGKSAHLADVIAGEFQSLGHETDIDHAGDLSLPACDGYLCYKDEKTINLTDRLSEADAIVLVSPVYNYDLNAAAKNLIELTGNSWKGKAIGLVCQAAGEKSYLAPLGFINSLAVDYRCLVSPRFVYVARSNFTEEGVLADDSPVRKRIHFLAQEVPVLAEAAKKIESFEKP